MPVRIVTDSAADLPEDLAAKLDIAVVPLTIRFGADEFVDRETLSPEEFYRRLSSSAVLPETAAPSPGQFEAAFRGALDAGADAVVCINLSSALSATMQSAQNAARALEGHDIRVIDSRSVTWGLGSQVLAAARAAADGASADEVVAVVDDLVARTHVYGTLDTLENLKKGGRIGNARALLGTMLSIKPIVDVTGGAVEEGGKARTRSKALGVLADKVAEAGVVENLAVMHGYAPDADDFVQLLRDRFPDQEIHVGIIGATIGTHGGPRVMGVTFQRRS